MTHPLEDENRRLKEALEEAQADRDKLAKNNLLLVKQLEMSELALREALVGESDMPECINPLSWIVEAAKELRRRGPVEGSDDPGAYWEMVREVESFIKNARVALFSAEGAAAADRNTSTHNGASSPGEASQTIDSQQ